MGPKQKIEVAVDSGPRLFCFYTLYSMGATLEAPRASANSRKIKGEVVEDPGLRLHAFTNFFDASHPQSPECLGKMLEN